MIFTNLIQTNLRTKVFGKKIEYYQRIGSTNEEAWELINTGEADHGTIVITDNQFSGKGRDNNDWYMSPSKSLAMSIIIKNEITIEQALLVPLAAGLAVAKTLKNRSFKPQLKWPNDIYYSNKKIGGILCESKIKNKEIDKIVIGIGINVNETIEEHPDNIHNDISTMFSITNHAHQRELIVAEFVNYFERLLNNISENSKMIIDEWQNLCMHMNQNISFHEKEKTNEGVFIGLNKEGYAKIEIDEKIQTYSSIHLI